MIRQLRFRRFQRARELQGNNQLGRFSADNMGAYQLTRLGMEDGFYHTFGFGQTHGLAVGAIAHAADLDRDTLILALFFGFAARADLRLAVGAARYIAVIHPVRMLAGNGFHADRAFMAGHMCKCRCADHITDGIDAGMIGAVPVIHCNRVAFDLHLCVFSADAIGIAKYAYSDQADVAFNCLLFAFGLICNHSLAIDIGGFGNHGAGNDLDALFLETAFNHFGDLMISSGRI